MAVLAALVVLVGMLCLLNLVLSFGVIRRLREHTELLAERDSPVPGLPVGSQAADFTATTTDGETVSRDLLSDDTLVAFLTPNCGPCREQLPELAKVAANWPGGRDRTLAVVAGDPVAAAAYVELLSPVARVVVEESLDSSAIRAFEVAGYPLFGLVDRDGTILRSTMAAADLQIVDATTA